MKTVNVSKDMSTKQRSLEISKAISELEDGETFTVIEELTTEKLREQMQAAITMFTADDELKTVINSVKLDAERNVLIIETVITQIPIEEEETFLLT